MADRYCKNCGQELPEDGRFCPNCGTPIQEVAHVPTPEADRPVPRIPPAAERNAWERIRYGTLDESPRNDQPRDPGVWTGVKLGCGMFIVLPIIIFVLMIFLLILVAGIGGSGG